MSLSKRPVSSISRQIRALRDSRAYPPLAIGGRWRLLRAIRAPAPAAGPVCGRSIDEGTLFMNLQNDPHSLALMKFGIGQPVPRTEDPILVRGAGPLHRRHQPAGPGLRGDRAQPRRARRHQGHRHRRGRARCPACSRLYRRRPRRTTARSNASCRSRTATAPPMTQAAAAGAADRQGALRRRSGRLRRRRDAAAGEGRRRGGRARHRAAARRGATRRTPRAGRAAALRRRARQRRARLSLRRQRAGRGRLRQGRARHAGSSSSTAASSSTRWSRAPRSAYYDAGKRPLHPARAVPGRVRHARQHGRDPQGRAQAGAHPDRQCRRLVRHEAAPFPEYVCVLHAARALGRPVKWTDERSGSFVSDSHGRDHEVTAELALDADGTLPRGAPHRLRQYGRASCRRSRRCRRRSTPSRTCIEHLPHAADRGLDQVRVHQHRRTSRPIAAPAGPRATTTWSG